MKKPAVFFLTVLALGILWSGLHPDEGTVSQINLALESPSSHSWFGRDALGRDLMIRIFQGAQVSIGIGMAASLAALIFGVIYGAVSALAPKKFDSMLMRVAEVLMALPSLMLMAVLALVLQTQIPDQTMVVLFGALALASWMSVAKLTRNLILQEKSREYIEAAKALGANPFRIFWRHLLPNVVSPLLTFWSLEIPHAILAEGLLSFLGFGVKSPGISWGALLQEGWKTLASYPHLLLGPSLILFLTVFSLNILLESFRKKMDPKLKWERFS